MVDKTTWSSGTPRPNRTRVPYQVTIDPDIATETRALAKKKGRTLSWLTEAALRAYLSAATEK